MFVALHVVSSTSRSNLARRRGKNSGRPPSHAHSRSSAKPCVARSLRAGARHVWWRVQGLLVCRRLRVQHRRRLPGRRGLALHLGALALAQPEQEMRACPALREAGARAGAASLQAQAAVWTSARLAGQAAEEAAAEAAVRAASASRTAVEADVASERAVMAAVEPAHAALKAALQAVGEAAGKAWGQRVPWVSQLSKLRLPQPSRQRRAVDAATG